MLSFTGTQYMGVSVKLNNIILIKSGGLRLYNRKIKMFHFLKRNVPFFEKYITLFKCYLKVFSIQIKKAYNMFTIRLSVARLTSLTLQIYKLFIIPLVTDYSVYGSYC